MVNDRPERLAGEFVLGTLDHAERKEAEELMAKDHRFAQSVADWNRWLFPLTEAIPSYLPPETLWSKIESTLDSVDGERASHVTVRTSDHSQIVQLRQKLATWRFATLATGFAALMLVLAVISGVDLPWHASFQDNQYVAMLGNDSGRYGFIVTVAPTKQKMMIRQLGVSAPPEKCHELWLIKSDGSVPSTLGIIKPGSHKSFDISGMISTDDLKKGLKLAVSVEPLSGAQSGLTMGPVVFQGDLMPQRPGSE